MRPLPCQFEIPRVAGGAKADAPLAARRRRVRNAAPYNPPKAPSDEGAVSRQADWGRDAGGHMGPPLQNPLKCNVERRRGQAPALQGRITDTRRTTGMRPGRRALSG